MNMNYEEGFKSSSHGLFGGSTVTAELNEENRNKLRTANFPGETT